MRIGLPVLALIALSACKPVNEPQFEQGDNASATAPAVGVATAAASRAGIAGCPDFPFVNDGTRTRKAALPVPGALKDILVSDRDHFAVTLLSGGTACVDTRSMDAVKNLSLSADKRFVSWDWDGMEAFGHVIVDRAGKGTEIDTGTAPVASPSGARIAAVDWSESAFGALNAFAVWDRAPGGLEQVARVESPPQGFTEWKIDGWQGEACVRLSAVRFSDSAEGKGTRTAFTARPVDGGDWAVQPAATEPCGAK